MKIGYFGDEHSNTYAAAINEYSGEFIGYRSITSLAQALSDGEVDIAVAPIENSVGGTVGECIDCLKNYAIYIIKQHVMQISHSLIAVEGSKLADVRCIYSHPQALAQCEKYVKAHFPKARTLSVGNTSEALKVIKSIGDAAIARAPLAGQVALDEHIEDVKTNFTKFVTLSRQPSFNGSTASVMFDINHRPGALLTVLTVLSQNNINMNKLESRPKRDGEFKYWFFVEFECGEGKDKLTDVMAQLSQKVELVKFLGMY